MDEKTALKRLQKEELEILKVFSDYCSRNGIVWFLDSGTALGAKRHKGFIPWDDDIDVGMLREDYDKFVKLAKKSFPQGYSYHDSSNTDGYAGMFGKIYKDNTCFATAETIEAGCDQGIFIDIFPFDYLYKDGSKRKKQLSQAALWKNVSYLYYSGTINVPHEGLLGSLEAKLCKGAHLVIKSLFNPSKFAEKFERSIPSLSGDGLSQEVACLPCVMGIMEDEVLVPPTYLEFEGEMYPVPHRIEEYLQAYYGDWLVVPEEKDRKTHLPLKIEFSDGEVFENPKAAKLSA